MSNEKLAVGVIIFLISLIIAIILLSISIKRVDSTEYGLKYDNIAKRLGDNVAIGGLHIGPPGFTFVKFPSTFETAEVSDTCVSLDGLRVKFHVTFQYQMPSDWMKSAIIKYRDLNGWKRIVEAAGMSAVQHSCSMFVVSEFQNKRGIIQSTMEDQLRFKLEGPNIEEYDKGVYARAISLQLKEVKLPQEYTTAVAEKQSAAEDIILAQAQRVQETTKATTLLLKATEESRIIMNTANNDANITLTQAILQAQQTMYAFQKEADVLVDVKSGLNLTTVGVLAYLSNQLYASAPKIRVHIQEPTKISRNLAAIAATEFTVEGSGKVTETALITDTEADRTIIEADESTTSPLEAESTTTTTASFVASDSGQVITPSPEALSWHNAGGNQPLMFPLIP